MSPTPLFFLLPTQECARRASIAESRPPALAWFRLVVWVACLVAPSWALWAQDAATWTTNVPSSSYVGSELVITATVTNVGTTTWDQRYSIFVVGTANPPWQTFSVPVTPPGGSVTISFHDIIPTAPRGWGYNFFMRLPDSRVFGYPSQAQANPQVTFTVNPTRNVWLSAYNFDPSAKPTISTDWSLSPSYMLRCKMAQVGNGYGYHAATSFNNNGKALDAVPPMGVYYPVSLYFLRYDDTGTNILEIGKESLHMVQIAHPTTSLSSYWFNAAQRPQIITDMLLPFNYRLVGNLVNTATGVAFTWNNNGTYLDNVPPPGTYQVQLNWQRYDITGQGLLETGTAVSETVTIDGSAAISALNGGGTITGSDNYDDDGNYTSTDYSSDVYNFSVPAAGQLHVHSSGANTDLWGYLYGDSVGNIGWTAGSNGADFTVHAQAGVFTLWVGGNSGGEYQIFADLTPDVPPPTITGPTSFPAATVGVALPGTGYQVTANQTGANVFLYAGGLPLGLVCNPATGVISGTPQQGGTFDIYLFAQNGPLIGPSTKVTLTVAVPPPPPPPSITTQPQSQTVAVGSAATFSVVAAGTSPLTYQWFKNSSTIANATSSSLTISSVQSSDVASYTVVVSNNGGSVTSTAATLALTPQNDPTNQTIKLNIHLPTSP